MLAKRAEKLEAAAKGSPLAGVIDWISLLPTLLSLLGLCKKPVKPEPVNPTPSPTPSQAAAWSDAWRLKSAAVDNWNGSSYDGRALQRTAAHIRQQKRRDGGKISKDEAQAAARVALDNARVSSMPELYGDVLEARHAS